MASLVPAHGGLAEPLDLTVPASEEAAFKAELAKLPKVPVSDADLSTVYRFGDGGLSPLTGPMDRATYERVLDHAYIEHNGQKYAWTIPLALPVDSNERVLPMAPFASRKKWMAGLAEVPMR